MIYELRDADREGYPDHQLSPLKGGVYNTFFAGPEGTDIPGLHISIEAFENNTVSESSGWKPTEQQIKQLESGAHIRVALWTHPIPPMAVVVEPPICGCHEKEMEWSEEESGYYCHEAPVNGKSPRTALEQAHADFTPEPVDPDDD